MMCKYAHMDWSHLEYFLAVARAGSLSGAAKRLQVNHTTVARRLDKLEQQLQVRLFDRLGSGYRLTEDGLALQQQTVIFCFFWLLLCMSGALGPIANAAHLGGFVVGILIGARQTLWKKLPFTS